MEIKKRAMEEKLKFFYKNKKILITGATGFKGSWLCMWLNYLGADIIGIGHSPNKNKNLFYSLNLQKKIKLNLLDIRNKIKLKKIINKNRPQIIFHMAAQPLIYDSYINPSLTYEVNSLGTLNIIDIVKDCKFVKSLVCITSDKCYENNNSTTGFKENDKLGGDDPYSGSKACAEIIAKTYLKSFFFSKNKKMNCGLATARAGNVIGGGDWSPNRLIPDAINSILNNKTIFLRNPNFNRPWQHVMEPLYGYLILAEKIFHNPKKFSGAWNFGTTKNTITNVFEIVKKIINYWGNGRVRSLTKKMFYEQKNLQLNIYKAKKKLKWKPKYTITESVNITSEWYKKVLVERISPEVITLDQIKKYMKKK